MERTGKNFRELAVQERVEYCIIEVPFGGSVKKRAIQIRALD